MRKGRCQIQKFEALARYHKAGVAPGLRDISHLEKFQKVILVKIMVSRFFTWILVLKNKGFSEQMKMHPFNYIYANGRNIMT